jgi:hypothetical protein
MTMRIIFYMATLLMCASCTLTSTRVNKDATYQGHPTRIFVVANLEATGDGVSAAFSRLFSTGVRACGGEMEFFLQRVTTESDALSLDNTTTVSDQKAFIERVSAFSPDVVLTMRVTHITLAGYGQKINATIDSRLWDYREKKSVWAGVSTMALGGIWASSDMRAKSLTDDLAQKLRDGGMIPSCPAVRGATT